MNKSETIAVIKDCIFESVLMGSDLITTLRDLHFKDGFKKEDILQAYHEMADEAE
jgi:hypothetical protein